MGCRIRPVSDEKCINGRAVSHGSLSKTLLFTTMCIVGLPVEVHIKDGSVYSGIFHTACLDDDYGVVLKKAKMIKKGKNDSNVPNGTCIETLVVVSGDLVQVVAKDVLFPSNGAVGNVADDSAEPIDCTVPVPEKHAKTTKISKISLDKKHFNQTRHSAQNENGYANGLTEILHGKVLKEVKLVPTIMNRRRDDTQATKIEEISIIPVNGRLAKDLVPRGDQNVHKEKSVLNETETVHNIQSSRSSLDQCDTLVKPSGEIIGKTTATTMAAERSCDNTASSVLQPDNRSCERSTSACTPSTDAISSGDPTRTIRAISSVPNKNSKEFKLNPAAKIFSPSFVNIQPPHVTSTATNMDYIPNSSPLVQVAVTRSGIDISTFAPRPSLPAKIDQYSNLTTGNGYQYSQPIVGYVGGRTQPARYAEQYHPVQAGPTYSHQNSQAVMAGRTGQFFYVHPVSHDAIHGTATISPARPIMTPHQIQYPKHQGTQAPQALQIYVPPHLLVGGSQPILIPSQIPLLQSPFIVNRSIPVPGSNGVYGTKFQ